jgi:hypothetical protein
VRRSSSRCNSWQGDHFSSRGEITIMRRFERCVVGGSPAARSLLFAELPASGRPPGSPSLCSGCAIFALPRYISTWPRSSGLRLLSGPTQVQILPRRLSESKTAKRGDRLEAVSGHEACGAGPLLSAIFLGERTRRGAGAVSKTDGSALPVEAQVLRSPPTLARSSKAERSPDKRVTTERYRPGQPLRLRSARANFMGG